MLREGPDDATATRKTYRVPTPPRVSGTDKVVSDRGLFLIYTGREAFGFDEPPLTRLVGNLLDVEPDCIGYKSIIQN